MPTLNDRTILITGGTQGIARETAVQLAQTGAHVIVTGHNDIQSQQAVADIKARSGNDRVDLLLVNLENLSEVRQLACRIQRQVERLDVLINHIDYMPSKRYLTVDGIEATLAVNHVAPFILIKSLLPMLKASAPSRIINVTGGTADNSRIDFKNLQAEQVFDPQSTYTHAKRIMTATSFDFAKYLNGTGVTLNVAIPGEITPDSRAISPLMRMVSPLFRKFISAPEPIDPTVASVYLATAPEVERVNGKLFNPDGRQTSWHSSLIGQDIPERLREYTMALLDQTAWKVA